MDDEIKRSEEKMSRNKQNITDGVDIEAIDSASLQLIELKASLTKNGSNKKLSKEELCRSNKLFNELKTSDLVIISEGLSGWEDNCTVLAPRYLPTETEAAAIFNLLSTNTGIPYDIFMEIARSKARATNFQNLIIKKEIIPFDSTHYKKLTERFILELRTGVTELDNLLGKLKFSTLEKEIFHLFVSRTASILHNLGFAEAVEHSGQVARKCVIESYRKNHSPVEMLQAVLGGWIHDPKLPGYFSWNNLSTHPVVASAIAQHVLTRDDILQKIEAFVRKYSKSSTRNKSLEDFIKGVVEAVAINNDSKFVLNNAILLRPSWAPGLPESGGIIDQVSSMSLQEISSLGLNYDSEELADDIKEIALKRLYAPSHMKKPASFNSDILKVLKKVRIETGLKAINLKEFENICKKLEPRYRILSNYDAMTVFNKILDGEITDKELVIDFSDEMAKQQDETGKVFIPIKVTGDRLFSHQDELKFAPSAASAIAIADNLLLSPCKILETGTQRTSLERMASFVESFKDNIDTLHKQSQAGGKIFQRDLFVSIVMAFDELTAKNNYEKFRTHIRLLSSRYIPFTTKASDDTEIEIIEDQINFLTNLITDKTNWLDESRAIDYSEVEPGNPQHERLFRQLMDTLKKHYNNALDKSPEMFGLIKLNKFELIKRFALLL